MEEKILSIISEVLEYEVTLETSQQNCETWDSMHHLNMTIALESEFDIEFEPEEIADMVNVKTIITVVNSKL